MRSVGQEGLLIMSFYNDCIREAAEKGLISKSYVNPLYIGFAANYESEPFLSIKEKISRGECVEGELGYEKDIELAIITALVADKRISKVASIRLMELFDSKRINWLVYNSSWKTLQSPYRPPAKTEIEEWNRVQEEKKIIEEKGKLTKERESVASVQCPYCKSSNVVRPSVAADQGSSSHLGVGIGSGGLGLGLGSSKTIEAKKARELQSKEFNENLGADESIAEKVGHSVYILTMVALYYLEFWVIGYNWGRGGDSVVLSIFILVLYIFIPLIVPAFINMYLTEKLESKGGRWSYIRKRSVTYWMCRSCGQTFTK